MSLWPTAVQRIRDTRQSHHCLPGPRVVNTALDVLLLLVHGSRGRLRSQGVVFVAALL